MLQITALHCAKTLGQLGLMPIFSTVFTLVTPFSTPNPALNGGSKTEKKNLKKSKDLTESVELQSIIPDEILLQSVTDALTCDNYLSSYAMLQEATQAFLTKGRSYVDQLKAVSFIAMIDNISTNLEGLNKEVGDKKGVEKEGEKKG
jgi:hypothetical protein